METGIFVHNTAALTASVMVKTGVDANSHAKTYANYDALVSLYDLIHPDRSD